jgi:protein-tyrosine phosphatase
VAFPEQRNGTEPVPYRTLFARHYTRTMREILRGKLWLGNMADVRNVENVLRAGVLAVIDLAADQPMPLLPRSLAYCRFPILDGQQDAPGVLHAALETIVSLLRNEIPTLVYCSMGMSRSPALVAGALAVLRGGSPDDRLREIAIGHPHDVSPELWHDVREVCAEMAQRNAP